MLTQVNWNSDSIDRFEQWLAAMYESNNYQYASFEIVDDIWIEMEWSGEEECWTLPITVIIEDPDLVDDYNAHKMVDASKVLEEVAMQLDDSVHSNFFEFRGEITYEQMDQWNTKHDTPMFQGWIEAPL